MWLLQHGGGGDDGDVHILIVYTPSWEMAMYEKEEHAYMHWWKQHVYMVFQTNRSGVHEAMNVFVFSVSINETYWYLYILHISFSKKIYSIFYTMRYTTYYPLFMILHTVILFLRGYSILYFFLWSTYHVLHTPYYFFRVCPYFILWSSAYCIIFCTVISYEVDGSW